MAREDHLVIGGPTLVNFLIGAIDARDNRYAMEFLAKLQAERTTTAAPAPVPPPDQNHASTAPTSFSTAFADALCDVLDAISLWRSPFDAQWKMRIAAALQAHVSTTEFDKRMVGPIAVGMAYAYLTVRVDVAGSDIVPNSTRFTRSLVFSHLSDALSFCMSPLCPFLASFTPE